MLGHNLYEINNYHLYVTNPCYHNHYLVYNYFLDFYLLDSLNRNEDHYIRNVLYQYNMFLV